MQDTSVRRLIFRPQTASCQEAAGNSDVSYCGLQDLITKSGHGGTRVIRTEVA